MKVNDLRQLSDKYCFQKSIQQLEDHKVLSDLRKENAIIKTVLKEKELNEDGING